MANGSAPFVAADLFGAPRLVSSRGAACLGGNPTPSARAEGPQTFRPQLMLDDSMRQNRRDRARLVQVGGPELFPTTAARRVMVGHMFGRCKKVES
jgi:hypothetical protein